MFTGLKATRWLLLLSGILCLVVGISLFSTPLSGILTIAIWIGISTLFSGLFEIAAYFSQEKEFRSGWVLAGGLISAFIGFWLLMGHGIQALTAFIPMMLAAWILISGIMRAIGSFSLKSSGAYNWGWVLAAGIAEAILGGLMMYHPILSVSFISTLLALLFIGHGISDVALFFGMSKVKKIIEG